MLINILEIVIVILAIPFIIAGYTFVSHVAGALLDEADKKYREENKK